MFAQKQLVRIFAPTGSAQPLVGWIASRPMGLTDVPAMGLFYFVIAPSWRGVVSADRLSAPAGLTTDDREAFDPDSARERGG